MDREQIICPCLDITIGQIMDAYEQGAKSVDMIKEATGAGRAGTGKENAEGSAGY